MLKLLSAAALATVAFADEPVGTVIGIDLGTTYSVSGACAASTSAGEAFFVACCERAALALVAVSPARAFGTTN